MINICVNGNCSLELIWEPKLFKNKANYEYNKFLNLKNSNFKIKTLANEPVHYVSST